MQPNEIIAQTIIDELHDYDVDYSKEVAELIIASLGAHGFEIVQRGWKGLESDTLYFTPREFIVEPLQDGGLKVM